VIWAHFQDAAKAKDVKNKERFIFLARVTGNEDKWLHKEKHDSTHEQKSELWVD
jgi:hypothetical protein